MIVEALRHEVGRITRSRARLAALAIFLAVSALAALAGRSATAEWAASLANVEREQAEATGSAREWLATGAKGPEDREWVDITQPLWQDWYASSRAIRKPAPLAPIAAGSADNSPTIIRIYRNSNPFLEEGTAIENPEFGSSEAIDLVFVLTVLVPILIFALGIGCGAYERERGIDRIIAVQLGSTASWFLARAGAIAFISLAVVLVVVTAALAAVGGLGKGAGELVLLSALYTLVWCGILTATAVAATSLREASFAYGGVWLLLVVLVPTLMSERSLASASAQANLTAALEQRAQLYSSYEADGAETVTRLYAARPELRTMPAAKLDALPPEVERHVLDWQGVQDIRKDNAIKLAEESRAIAQAERDMAWSPAAAMTLASERLAGRDMAATQAFRTEVVERITQRVDWVLTAAWANKPLTAENFERLVTTRSEPVVIATTGIAPHFAILAIWALAAWGVGVILIRKREPGR